MPWEETRERLGKARSIGEQDDDLSVYVLVPDIRAALKRVEELEQIKADFVKCYDLAMLASSYWPALPGSFSGTVSERLKVTLAAEHQAREAAEAKLAVREHPAAICVHDGLADPQRLSVCLMCEEAITQDLRAKLAKVVEALELGLALAKGELINFKHYGLKSDDDISGRIEAALAAAKGE